MRKFILVIILIGLVAMSLSAQDKPLKVIKYKAPKYPSAAFAVRAKGEVVIEVKIDKSGKVTSAIAISGHPLLRETSINIAKEWIFSTNKNNSERTIQIQFTYSINSNNQAKNNNKNPTYKTKFRNPYNLEIIATLYPITNNTY